MGQRLVLSVRNIKTGTVLANVYKHWSAYTGCAIDETNTFIDAFNNWMNEHPGDKGIFNRVDDEAVNRQKEIVIMVMMEAWPGACPAGFKEDVDEEDEENDPDAGKKYAANVKMLLMSMGMMELVSKLDDEFSYDRNEGLIGITDSGIENYQSWSEGDVDVGIDAQGEVKEVYFGVIWGESYQEALEEEESEADLLDCMYETDFVNNDDFGAFSLDDWYEFVEIYDKAQSAHKYKLGSKKNDAVWSFIE